MRRILAIADSDSYLKWSAATLAALPADFEPTQVVVTSPLTPSRAQFHAAGAADVPVVGASGLLSLVKRQRPDVVLLAATGPVVAVLARRLAGAASRARPVLVTGLPGISFPPSRRAVELRRGCDLLLVHSRREYRAYAEVLSDVAPWLTVGLARLPFLDLPRPERVRGSGDVVFAAQAKVPASRDQRRAVLSALAAIEPGGAVVKLRAGSGEAQTHRERLPYDRLWHEMVAEGVATSGRVRFTHAPMAEALVCARACVTVSSTAALEAMAAGVEVLILDDFGVSADLINLVFEESGCLGSLDDVSAGRFRQPTTAWMQDNYLHDRQESDWLDRLGGLLSQRAEGPLLQHRAPPVGGHAAAVRRRLRLHRIARRA
jgi:hypothetical protein